MRNHIPRSARSIPPNRGYHPSRTPQITPTTADRSSDQALRVISHVTRFVGIFAVVASAVEIMNIPDRYAYLSQHNYQNDSESFIGRPESFVIYSVCHAALLFVAGAAGMIYSRITEQNPAASDPSEIPRFSV
jgi:hypothetical protein